MFLKLSLIKRVKNVHFSENCMKMVRMIMIYFQDMKTFSEAFWNKNYHNGFKIWVWSWCLYYKRVVNSNNLTLNAQIISKHGLCPLKYQGSHGVTLRQRQGWSLVISQPRREGWWRCHQRFRIIVMGCWWLIYNTVSYWWYGKWQSEPGRVGGSFYPQKFQGRMTHGQRKWHLLWKKYLGNR